MEIEEATMPTVDLNSASLALGGDLADESFHLEWIDLLAAVGENTGAKLDHDPADRF